MRNVFDPSEVELADLRGDPSRAIEIQKKVKEILEANRQRQEGIRQNIVDQGAWAMPGLINSTFIWMNELENNAPGREILIDLISKLGQNNEAAGDLLFRIGVLDNPFPIPRKIASASLKKMNWVPNKNNIKSIKTEIKTCRKNEDIKKALDLYGVLLLTGNKAEMNIALTDCRKWTEASYKECGDLLTLLVKTNPDRIQEILVPVFLSAADAHEEAHKDKTIANTLVDALMPIPENWLIDGLLVDVSCEVLLESFIPRHTGIEYLWNRATQIYYEKNQASWDTDIRDIGDQVFQAGKKIADAPEESLYRYWFEALQKVGEVDYLNEQAYEQDELWSSIAAVELFFAKGKGKKVDKKAMGMLRELESNKPRRYERAEMKYSDITGGSKTTSELKERRGPAGLRKAG